MKVSSFFSMLLLVILSSCGGAKNNASTPEQITAIKELLDSKEYRIENQWAMPTVSSSMMRLANSGLAGPGSNVQRINLIGNTNYLEVKGDSVKAYLPFFGERQMGGGYNSEGEGIQFEQVVTDMKTEYVEAKKRYLVTFSANNGTESFDINLLVYPNNKTSLSVNSSQRDFITYDGTISPLPEKKE